MVQNGLWLYQPKSGEEPYLSAAKAGDFYEGKLEPDEVQQKDYCFYNGRNDCLRDYIQIQLDRTVTGIVF